MVLKNYLDSEAQPGTTTKLTVGWVISYGFLLALMVFTITTAATTLITDRQSLDR